MGRRRQRKGGAAAGAAGVLWLLVAGSSVADGQAPADPAALPAPAAPPAPVNPPGGIARWLNPATAPFIPIPEIDVDPQSGVTLGVIATFLDVNQHGEIERITAPDVFHSQYFGWGAGLSLYGFPPRTISGSCWVA